MSDAVSPRHRFTVHLDPDPNALARLLEPFVIHDVMPARLEAVHDPGVGDCQVVVEFAADTDLVRRLGDRLEGMHAVRRLVRLASDDLAVVAA